MNDQKRKSWTLLIIALVLILGGSLLASWIQTGAGAATVHEIKFYGSYDGHYVAHLFVPKGITTGNPAPGVLTAHGYNNSKEYMNNTALELARRGYVVLSMDLDKHGFSASSNAPSPAANAYGALDGLKYLRSLDIVDPDNVGLIGMSMGSGAVETAAQMLPDGYKSLFFMDGSCSVCEKDKNFAVSWGTGSEVPQPWGAMNGSQILSMPAAMELFETDQPIVEGKVYGSIAEGTGKVIYTHFGNHPYSTDDPVSIGNAITWFGLTLEGAKGANIPSSNQIWPNKNLGTGVAFVGFVVFLIAIGGLLLQTPYFATLNEKLPVYKGNTGLLWWAFAIFTTLIGPLTVYKLFLAFFMANPLRLEGITTGFIGWMMVVGLITIAVLIAGYFIFGRKAGATGVNYGLTWEKAGIDWRKIGKSFLLALAVVASGYILLMLVTYVLMVDFRFWILTLKITDLRHLVMILPYLIPAAIYFVSLSVALHGTLRPKNGEVSLGREMLINVIVLLVGLIAVLAYYYVPLEFFGAPANFGPGGLGLINAIALIGLIPAIAVISTYFFRKTGHVYVGALVNTLFIVWYLVAANTVFSFGA
jgi:pimeloyl-ACP methyl ester carboxylesterase